MGRRRQSADRLLARPRRAVAGPCPSSSWSTAVQQQVARGTHYGANHELEIRWAEQVKHCFPHIEQLRFTASGTEATLLALRLARAFTGRPTIMRLAGHFHGWHDLLAIGAEGKTRCSAGLAPGIVELNGGGRSNRSMRSSTHAPTRDDIAAIIVEPSGASYGKQPLAVNFLTGSACAVYAPRILLICDEVVTGFRVAPGGMQQQTGSRGRSDLPGEDSGRWSTGWRSRRSCRYPASDRLRRLGTGTHSTRFAIRAPSTAIPWPPPQASPRLNWCVTARRKPAQPNWQDNCAPGSTMHSPALVGRAVQPTANPRSSTFCWIRPARSRRASYRGSAAHGT